jgi:hypothetical protein
MKGTHQRKSAVTFALAATTVAVIALLVATGCGKKQEETPKEIVRPVKVFTLGQAAGRRTMDLPGETRAIRQAVLAFEVSGRISELLIKEGDVGFRRDWPLPRKSRDESQARHVRRLKIEFFEWHKIQFIAIEYASLGTERKCRLGGN